MVAPRHLRAGHRSVGANANGGRDFVAGDLHGHFDTLRTMLRNLEWDPDRDRLLGVGDLVDRGPKSWEALQWITTGRITAAVRGNHEQMLLEHLEHCLENLASVGGGTAEPPGTPWHRWIHNDVPPTHWEAWRAMLEALPIAVSVATRRGRVGIVHASPTRRRWCDTVDALKARDADTAWVAMHGHARARRNREAARNEEVPFDGDIDGVRAVITGHNPMREVERTANVWHIDTGAGFDGGALSIARIDCEPIEITTQPVEPHSGQGTAAEEASAAAIENPWWAKILKHFE